MEIDMKTISKILTFAAASASLGLGESAEGRFAQDSRLAGRVLGIDLGHGARQK